YGNSSLRRTPTANRLVLRLAVSELVGCDSSNRDAALFPWMNRTSFFFERVSAVYTSSRDRNRAFSGSTTKTLSNSLPCALWTVRAYASSSGDALLENCFELKPKRTSGR